MLGLGVWPGVPLQLSGTWALARPLCPYPDPDAIYTGGDPNAASSYTCSSRPHFTNPFLLKGNTEG